MLPYDTLSEVWATQSTPACGVIFLTDRGIEYATYAFRERLATLGFMQRWW